MLPDLISIDVCVATESRGRLRLTCKAVSIADIEGVTNLILVRQFQDQAAY